MRSGRTRRRRETSSSRIPIRPRWHDGRPRHGLRTMPTRCTSRFAHSIHIPIRSSRRIRGAMTKPHPIGCSSKLTAVMIVAPDSASGSIRAACRRTVRGPTAPPTTTRGTGCGKARRASTPRAGRPSIAFRSRSCRRIPAATAKWCGASTSTGTWRAAPRRPIGRRACRVTPTSSRTSTRSSAWWCGPRRARWPSRRTWQCRPRTSRGRRAIRCRRLTE